MTPLTSEQFLAGILAVLAQRDWSGISMRGDRFDRASAAAYSCLEDIADSYGVKPRFYVVQDPAYGESPVIRDAITHLAQWDIVSLDNPEYQDVRLKMSPGYAQAVLSRLDLNPDLFAKLADTFVSTYEGQPAEM